MNNDLVRRARRISTTMSVLAVLSLIGGVGVGALMLVGSIVNAMNDTSSSDGTGAYGIAIAAAGVLWWGVLALGGLVAEYIAQRSFQNV